MLADGEESVEKRNASTASSFTCFVESHIAAIKVRMAAAGHITEADSADLNALADLQALSSEPVRPHRWIPMTLFLMTICLIGILFFTRVCSARIDFQGDLSELSFTTLTSHELPFPSDLKSLALGGAEPIDLSSLNPLSGECRSLQPQNLRLTASGPGKDHGNIGLSELTIPSKSLVTVSHKTGALFSSDVLILPPRNARDGMSADLTASGAVQATTQGCKIDLKADTHPQILVNFAKGEQANFSTVSFGDADPQDLEIPVDRVDLFSVDAETASTSNEAGSANSLRRSTILSGILYFDSVPGVTRTLRVEELLSFKDLKGMLRIIKVSKDHLTIRFTGTVKGLYTGEGDGNENIMPTCFEWLSASHGLFALCASGLYVFGLVLSLAKWWGLKV